MPFYFVVFLVVLVDQASKFWIRSHVKIGAYTTVWGLPVTHYENSGIAHSMLQGFGRYFAVAAFIFVIIILYYRSRSVHKGVLLEMSLGFLSGGALGNAIDRVVFGHVTDFLLINSGRGILNLSDYSINIGVVLYLVNFIYELLIKKKRSIM
jgi:signal peptidase II